LLREYPLPVSDAISVACVRPDQLHVYSGISIAFEVRSRLAVEVADEGFGGIRLREEPVDPPYWKDYDIDGNGPSGWPANWPIANWGLLLAYSAGTAVGGAAVAANSPGMHMTERYPDSACLWDIRVQTGFRSQGIGAMLLKEAEVWAMERGYRRMHVETQNVNVPACRFYRSKGFRLFAVDLRAYPELPDETMMLWDKPLSR